MEIIGVLSLFMQLLTLLIRAYGNTIMDMAWPDTLVLRISGSVFFLSCFWPFRISDLAFCRGFYRRIESTKKSKKCLESGLGFLCRILGRQPDQIDYFNGLCRVFYPTIIGVNFA